MSTPDPGPVDPRQLATGQQVVPLAQLNRNNFPELMLAYMATQARDKMVEAMEKADLIADVNTAMVTVRVEVMATPRVKS